MAEIETWSDADREALEEIRDDHLTVRAHRNVALGASVDNGITHCRTCGEPRPCSTATDPAARYGVTGSGDASFGAHAVLTREERDSDRVGFCVCGLRGQQAYHRISQPGEPEQWVRGQGWTCIPTRPAPHFRVD